MEIKPLGQLDGDTDPLIRKKKKPILEVVPPPEAPDKPHIFEKKPQKPKPEKEPTDDLPPLPELPKEITDSTTAAETDPEAGAEVDEEPTLEDLEDESRRSPRRLTIVPTPRPDTSEEESEAMEPPVPSPTTAASRPTPPPATRPVARPPAPPTPLASPPGATGGGGSLSPPPAPPGGGSGAMPPPPGLGPNLAGPNVAPTQPNTLRGPEVRRDDHEAAASFILGLVFGAGIEHFRHKHREKKLQRKNARQEKAQAKEKAKLKRDLELETRRSAGLADREHIVDEVVSERAEELTAATIPGTVVEATAAFKEPEPQKVPEIANKNERRLEPLEPIETRLSPEEQGERLAAQAIVGSSPEFVHVERQDSTPEVMVMPRSDQQDQGGGSAYGAGAYNAPAGAASQQSDDSQASAPATNQTIVPPGKGKQAQPALITAVVTLLAAIGFLLWTFLR